MDKSKKKVNKASEVKDPNKYIWIKRNNDSTLLTDPSVQLEVYDKEQGVAYYWKENKNNILMLRFARSKGWTESSAQVFTFAFQPTQENAQKALQEVNEYTGGEYLNYNIRKSVYDFLTPICKSLDIQVPELNSQKIYKNMANMKEKMRKLVELSNMKFQDFIAESQACRLDIVKSVDDKKEIEKNGFKILGTVEAFKVVTKAADGSEQESWRLRTRFTSNKADSTMDITSKEAIVKAVDKLQNSVIPIRFEHESQDYGVWDTFYTDEIDGILYGYAEGELYQQYARSKDLWHDLYDLNKKFGTSYGGYWVDFHWYMDEDTEDCVLRVFDEVVFEEISLTTRPANPDTALEVLNKYAAKLETLVRDDITYEQIKSMKTKKNLQDTDETKSVAPVETNAAESQETIVEPVVEPKEEVAKEEKVEDTGSEVAQVEAKAEVAETEEKVETETKVEAETEETKEELKEKAEEKSLASDSQEIVKSMGEMLKSMQEMTKTIGALRTEVETLKKQPSERKSIASFKDDEIEKTLSPEEKQLTEMEQAKEDIKKKYPFAGSLII